MGEMEDKDIEYIQKEIMDILLKQMKREGNESLNTKYLEEYLNSLYEEYRLTFNIEVDEDDPYKLNINGSVPMPCLLNNHNDIWDLLNYLNE